MVLLHLNNHNCNSCNYHTATRWWDLPPSWFTSWFIDNAILTPACLLDDFNSILMKAAMAKIIIFSRVLGGQKKKLVERKQKRKRGENKRSGKRIKRVGVCVFNRDSLLNKFVVLSGFAKGQNLSGLF